MTISNGRSSGWSFDIIQLRSGYSSTRFNTSAGDRGIQKNRNRLKPMADFASSLNRVSR